MAQSWRGGEWWSDILQHEFQETNSVVLKESTDQQEGNCFYSAEWQLLWHEVTVPENQRTDQQPPLPREETRLRTQTFTSSSCSEPCIRHFNRRLTHSITFLIFKAQGNRTRQSVPAQDLNWEKAKWYSLLYRSVTGNWLETRMTITKLPYQEHR